jgi:hypothetical protein
MQMMMRGRMKARLRERRVSLLHARLCVALLAQPAADGRSQVVAVAALHAVMFSHGVTSVL